jgi:hypothetical protein
MKMVATLAALAVVTAVSSAGQEGNWRKWQDPYSKARGNCPECQDGEAMVSSTVSIPNSGYVDIDNPPCGDPSFNSVSVPASVKKAVAAYFYAQDGGTVSGTVATFAVGIAEQTINAVAAAASVDAGELGRLTRMATGQPQVSSCGRAIVTIPKTVNVTRIVPTMHCPANGWCALANQPATAEVDGSLFAVSVVGKNWSHNNGASVTLKVFYTR